MKEEKITIRFETFNNISPRNLKKLINNNIKNFFPVDTEKFIFDYRILSNTDNILSVMLVSLQKDIVQQYLDFLEELNLTCYAVDFYQNTLVNVFAKHGDDKTFIVCLLDSKISFIYMENNKLVNIRNIDYLNEEDLIREINKSFGFYSNEIFQIEKIILIDNIEIIENTFSRYNIEIIKDIKSLTGIELEQLSFYGVDNLKRYAL